ncbi:MAG: hypothetical protein WC344_05290 [Bacilli bacterium]|jgi:hypothetical protein
MSMHVVTFRLNLNEKQFQELRDSLKPYLPDSSRLELFLRKHSPVSRVTLMRHGKFTAHEIDLALKAFSDNIIAETHVKGKRKETTYIWKEK